MTWGDLMMWHYRLYLQDYPKPIAVSLTVRAMNAHQALQEVA